MEKLTELVVLVEGFISTNILLYVLIGLGAYFTFRTRAAQLRLFGQAWKLLGESRNKRGDSLSSFQAFTVGLASRVGTGNIAGVALALVLGGPGALFWMWVVAILGMATSFTESTLAQLFKVHHQDRIYRGGPAYYMERGLGSRAAGVVFAALLVFSYGLVFPMVQANTIAAQLHTAWKVPAVYTAIILVVISIPIILKGLRTVAKATEIIVPIMALIYLIVALVIIVLNIASLPQVITDILAGAFGLKAGLAGTAGGVFAAITNGAKRGLFSNEAGQGSMPNGAATADVPHPVNQGLIQSLGTFIDTIVVCSATGFMILLAGKDVYQPGQELDDGLLTQTALTHHLDYGTGWTLVFMTVVVFLFSYSSVLGYSVFAEININYLKWGRTGVLGLRILMISAVGIGAVIALELAWSLADLALALMTIMNMVAVALLGRYAWATLSDYDRQRKAGIVEPVFISAEALPDLPIKGSVWTREEMAKFL